MSRNKAFYTEEDIRIFKETLSYYAAKQKFLTTRFEKIVSDEFVKNVPLSVASKLLGFQILLDAPADSFLSETDFQKVGKDEK